MRTEHHARALAALLAVATLTPERPAQAACLDTPGDVTGNGETTTTDVQCTILTALAELGEGDVPECLAGPPSDADLDCDDAVSVVDVLLVVKLALGAGLGPQLDADGDLCADACGAGCGPEGTPCDDGDPCTLGACSADAECVASPPSGLFLEAESATALSSGMGLGTFCGEAGWSAGQQLGGAGTAEFAVSAPIGGYTLWIRYASLASRPISVLQDDALIGPGALSQPTGGYCGANATWSAAATVIVTSDGPFTIRLEAGLYPHIDALLLLPDGPSPPATWSAGDAFGPADGLLGLVPCDDGDACTIGDACSFGQCVGGGACEDGDPCTDDSCDPASGCVFVPNAVPCDDGDACTIGDACEGGACQPGAPAGCDDGSPCTSDSCEPATGCVFAEPGGLVREAEAPTVASPDATFIAWCSAEGWSGGLHLAGRGFVEYDFTVPAGTYMLYFRFASGMGHPTNVWWDDQLVAPNAVPNPTGVYPDAYCHTHAVWGHLTNVTAAKAGTYTLRLEANKFPHIDTIVLLVPGSPLPPVFSGAGFGGTAGLSVALPCGTADACLGEGSCAFGECAQAALGCDDGNPCTDDSCDALAGCVYADSAAPCSDGDACTVGDSCQAGACAPGAPADCGGDGGPCSEATCLPDLGCVANIGRVVEAEAYAEGSSNLIVVAPCGASGWSGGQVAWSGGGAAHYPMPLPAGPVSVWVRYASDLNGTLSASLLGGPSVTKTYSYSPGGSCGSGAAWLHLGDLTVPYSGPHTVVVSNPGPFPHLDAVAVMPPGEAPPGAWTPGTPGFGEADGFLEPVACSDDDPCTASEVCVFGECVATAIQQSCVPDPFCEATASAGVVLEAESFSAADPTIQPGAWCGSAGWSGGAHIGGIGAVHYDVHLPPGTHALWARYAQAENRWVNFELDGELIAYQSLTPSTGSFCGTSPVWTHVADLGVEDGGAHVLTLYSWSTFPHVDALAILPSGVTPPATFAAGGGFGLAEGLTPPLPCAVDTACAPPATCVFGACVPGAPCDDGNECTIDACDAGGACTHTPAPDGPCNDGSLCTTNDACQGGVCTGAPLSCTDGIACTQDACSPKTGCVFAQVEGMSCDDGDACTTNDACAGGTCAGAPVSCADGDPCTVDACDPATGCSNAPLECATGLPCVAGTCIGGACLEVPVDAACCEASGGCGTIECSTCVCLAMPSCCATTESGGGWTQACANLATTACGASCRCDAAQCDDGNPCTTGDACSGAAGCIPEFPSCDDGNPCTADTCDPATGCVHTPTNEGAVCTDGNACMVQTCAAGQCTDKAGLKWDCCLGDPKADGICSVTNACMSCVFQSANACVLTGFDPLSVLCQQHMATNCSQSCGCQLVLCDDGEPCTSGDACDYGDCVPAAGLPCDDGNPCTQDACISGESCVHTPADGALCDDGQPCTGPDTCTSGVCAGPPSSGAPCNDGNPCTSPDVCTQGTCAGADQSATLCSDGSACTYDLCSPAEFGPDSFLCSHFPVECDDQKDWSTDNCDNTLGCTATIKPSWSCAGNCGGISANGQCSCEWNCGHPNKLPCCPDACESCCFCGYQDYFCASLINYCGAPDLGGCGCDDACNVRGDCCKNKGGACGCASVDWIPSHDGIDDHPTP
jgi:hypothetical protein